MKWIDYTALTLAIIGAIVWGLIGVFQFNLVSFFFGENSWFSRLIYDLVGLSGLYLLTLFGRIGRDMYFVPSILYSDNIYILGCV